MPKKKDLKFPGDTKKQKHYKIKMLSKEDWRRFIRHLKKTGNLKAACESSGVSERTVYDRMKKYPEMAREVDEARAQVCQDIENEIRRRGLEGYEEPVYYQGEEVGSVTRYSDRLLEKFAKANMPERYSDKAQVDMNHTVDLSENARGKLASLLNVNDAIDVTPDNDHEESSEP